MCRLQWNTRSFGISACLVDLYEFYEKCLDPMDVICTQKAPGTTAPQSCAEQIETRVSFTKFNGCTADKKRQSAEFRDVCKDCSNTSSRLGILGKVYCVLGKIDIPPGASGKCHSLDWLTQVRNSGELHGFHCRVTEEVSHPFFLLSMSFINWGRRKLA